MAFMKGTERPTGWSLERLSRYLISCRRKFPREVSSTVRNLTQARRRAPSASEPSCWARDWLYLLFLVGTSFEGIWPQVYEDNQRMTQHVIFGKAFVLGD